MVFWIVVNCLLWIGICSSATSDNKTVEILPMDQFASSGKLALHFPCAECNVFATNCACHVRCTDPKCKNAINLCEKYKDRWTFNPHIVFVCWSRRHGIGVQCFNDLCRAGCRYVLTRGGVKKIATLKRIPTSEELKRFKLIDWSIFSFCPWRPQQPFLGICVIMLHIDLTRVLISLWRKHWQ